MFTTKYCHNNLFKFGKQYRPSHMKVYKYFCAHLKRNSRMVYGSEKVSKQTHKIKEKHFISNTLSP
jgi:hypothetical protein